LIVSQSDSACLASACDGLWWDSTGPGPLKFERDVPGVKDLTHFLPRPIWQSGFVGLKTEPKFDCLFPAGGLPPRLSSSRSQKRVRTGGLSGQRRNGRAFRGVRWFHDVERIGLLRVLDRTLKSGRKDCSCRRGGRRDHRGRRRRRECRERAHRRRRGRCVDRALTKMLVGAFVAATFTEIPAASKMPTNVPTKKLRGETSVMGDYPRKRAPIPWYRPNCWKIRVRTCGFLSLESGVYPAQFPEIFGGLRPPR